MSENIFTVKEKYESLKKIAVDLHWMARRYADGRQSYVTYQFNELTRLLQAMGIELNPSSDKTIWARDAMGRTYDGLSKSEAHEGDPYAEWKQWEDEETERLRSALRFYADRKNWDQKHEPFAFKEYCSIAVFPSPTSQDMGKVARTALRGEANESVERGSS